MPGLDERVVWVDWLGAEGLAGYAKGERCAVPLVPAGVFMMGFKLSRWLGVMRLSPVACVVCGGWAVVDICCNFSSRTYVESKTFKVIKIKKTNEIKKKKSSLPSSLFYF